MDPINADIPNTSAEEVTTAPIASTEAVAEEQVIAEETPAPAADAVAM